MEDGGWRMEDHIWRIMEDGKRMEGGGWMMDDGLWRMGDDGGRRKEDEC